ncbi:hypothetical protein MTR67_043726 [Solanum verrucosum]|uniref:Uncharacterized protein n=1 Tax=Solanum verrucosum TaxID=315347 RepID=A0AAF0ZSY3_SOLVR|nr:hypothetical protein MTR67_043726 [Solanum verrucosum]
MCMEGACPLRGVAPPWAKLLVRVADLFRNENVEINKLIFTSLKGLTK